MSWNQLNNNSCSLIMHGSQNGFLSNYNCFLLKEVQKILCLRIFLSQFVPVQIKKLKWDTGIYYYSYCTRFNSNDV